MNTFLMGDIIKRTDDWRVIKNKNIMKDISFLSPNTWSEQKKKEKINVLVNLIDTYSSSWLYNRYFFYSSSLHKFYRKRWNVQVSIK